MTNYNRIAGAVLFLFGLNLLRIRNRKVTRREIEVRYQLSWLRKSITQEEYAMRLARWLPIERMIIGCVFVIGGLLGLAGLWSR